VTAGKVKGRLAIINLKLNNCILPQQPVQITSNPPEASPKDLAVRSMKMKNQD